MSIAAVEQIEGSGTRERSRDGASLLHYRWTKLVKDISPAEIFDLTFLFKDGRLTAMDYGYGF